MPTAWPYFSRFYLFEQYQYLISVISVMHFWCSEFIVTQSFDSMQICKFIYEQKTNVNLTIMIPFFMPSIYHFCNVFIFNCERQLDMSRRDEHRKVKYVWIKVRGHRRAIINVKSRETRNTWHTKRSKTRQEKTTTQTCWTPPPHAKTYKHN